MAAPSDDPGDNVGPVATTPPGQSWADVRR